MSEQVPVPLRLSELAEYRLVQVEKDVSSLNTWREAAREQLAAINVTIQDNTRRLNQIGLVATGTLVSVIGAIVAYFLSGGHH